MYVFILCDSEKTPKLIPETGSTYYHRVQHYRELLDSLPMDAYTHGCILHPELTVDSHIPAYANTRIRGKQHTNFCLLTPWSWLLLEKIPYFGQIFFDRLWKENDHEYKNISLPKNVMHKYGLLVGFTYWVVVSNEYSRGEPWTVVCAKVLAAS